MKLRPVFTSSCLNRFKDLSSKTSRSSSQPSLLGWSYQYLLPYTSGQNRKMLLEHDPPCVQRISNPDLAQPRSPQSVRFPKTLLGIPSNCRMAPAQTLGAKHLCQVPQAYLTLYLPFSVMSLKGTSFLGPPLLADSGQVGPVLRDCLVWRVEINL